LRRREDAVGPVGEILAGWASPAMPDHPCAPEGEEHDDGRNGGEEVTHTGKANRCVAGARRAAAELAPGGRSAHNGSVRSPAQAFGEWVVAHITRPRQEYRRYVFNDPERLKSRIRPGDVVLVDGDQRVSQVVKYLTMSPWSHSALFVGSRMLRDPSRRTEIRRTFGKESRYLIVEALVDRGVVLSPLTKYIDFNIRVCRPVGLTPPQIETVMDEVVARLGFRYDRRNILDLFRYLLPVRFIPNRLREDMLHFGSGKDTETICSSFLAEAFAKVGLSILPLHIRRRAVKRGRLRERVFGRPTRTAYSGFLKARHPSLCVPQDFDLSPSFDVVKFNTREPIRFPYTRED
jgi:hypothetical protein